MPASLKHTRFKAHTPQDSALCEINMVPMIDIMLVLLVIFMIVAPMSQQALHIELPNANSHTEQRTPLELNVQVRADGSLLMDTQTLSSSADTAAIEQAARQWADAQGPRSADTTVRLLADKSVPYERVHKAMAALSRAGLKQIAFVAQPE